MSCTAPLPQSLSACKSLVCIDLGCNKLNGPFPSAVVATIHQLKELRVPWNHFSGQFEDIIRDLPVSIRVLDLGANRIQGSIPFFINRIERLRELYLYKNSLEGQISEESFSNCRFLKVISIECNHFSGVLPLDMLEMKALKLFYASNNHFGVEGMSEFTKEMKKKFFKDPETVFQHLLEPQTPMSVANVVERFTN